jgi:hypothetical protein
MPGPFTFDAGSTRLPTALEPRVAVPSSMGPTPRQPQPAAWLAAGV